MADIVSPEKRSQMMAGINGKDTKPELLVRKALHKAGFRYRLHDKKLAGKPDMVFPKLNIMLFFLYMGVSGMVMIATFLNGHLAKWNSGIIR